MATHESDAECVKNFHEYTYTHDRAIIQDYDQYLNSGTASLVLSSEKRDKPDESNRLQATYDLLEAVNWAKFSGNMLVNMFDMLDFSARGNSPIARGGYFQTRQVQGLGVAKYPIIKDDSGLLPKSIYKSIMLELRILSHEILKEHENIVKLVSVQWTRMDPVAHSWIPVLLLEEAHHGSLQKYVAHNKIGFYRRLQLCLEIGRGLQALHAHGVIHGDLKFENVLVFDLGGGRVRAKLSDFGSSVIKDTKTPTVTITTGTPPWNSPEYNQPIEASMLCAIDTYSFGLLAWKLYLGGRNPFEGQSEEDIERRKMQDCILSDAIASLEDNYIKNMLLEGTASSGSRYQTYGEAVSMPRRCLEHCLSLSMQDRDLDAAVRSLSYDAYGMADGQVILDNTGDSEDKSLFSGSRFIVNHLRLFDTPRSVRAMVHQCVTDISQNSQSVDTITGIESFFQLSLQTLDSFGPLRDSISLAVSHMKDAAEAGHPVARASLWQFYEAAGTTMDPSMRTQAQQFLSRAVQDGSLLARICLRPCNARELQDAEAQLAQKVTGIKKPEEVDIDLVAFVEALFSEENLETMSKEILRAGATLENVWLGSCRSTYLHVGAAFGVEVDRFRAYVKLMPPSINARDAEGNTPLLLALRFNHVEIAIALLNNGADPSLSNNRGQTPWHWLVAIEKPEDVRGLAQLLHHRGVSALDSTAEPPDKYIDIFGISHGGTALHWAVEMGMLELSTALVSCGADIQRRFKQLTPVDIAIRRNRPDILELFLGELTRRGKSLARGPLPFTLSNFDIEDKDSYENLVVHATALHPFHERRILGGRQWAESLQKTLLILRKFGLAPKLPIAALSHVLGYMGSTTDVLEILVREGFVDGSDDLATFWAEVAECIIPTADVSNVLYAMKRAKAYSSSDRIPNAKKLLSLCTTSMGCDGTAIDYLASDGVDIDCSDGDGRTPLMSAVLNRNFEVASALLQHGANIHATWRPFFPGSSPGKKRPEVNILYEYLTINLYMALVPLRYLLEPLHPKKDSIPSFVVVPEDGTTALHLVCRHGNPILVDYIIKKFSAQHHLDAQGPGGLTALHHAVFNGHVEVVKKLCQHGAQVNILSGDEASDPTERYHPLDFCYPLDSPQDKNLAEAYGLSRDAQDVYLGRLAIADILTNQYGATPSPDKPVEDPEMPLPEKLSLYAAQNGMTRLLAHTLEYMRKHPSPSSKPHQDLLDDLLVNAAVLNQPTTTKFLIDHGANVRAHRNLSTLLHAMASKKQTAEIAYILLQAGAEVNAEDEDGQTPLSYAPRYSDLPTCRVLKHFGAVATLPRDAMARIIAERGGDRDRVMGLLMQKNIGFDIKLRGEPSDDDTDGGDDGGNSLGL